jgi:hypothetical protein
MMVVMMAVAPNYVMLMISVIIALDVAVMPMIVPPYWIVLPVTMAIAILEILSRGV